MVKKREGKIIRPKGLKVQPHESNAVRTLEKHGFSGEMIEPVGIKGNRTPDLSLGGVLWEIKSPTGKSRQTIERQFKRAVRQSRNIIIDTRRTKLDDAEIEGYIKLRLKNSRNTKKVMMINKRDKIIVDFKK
ncbi:hypothetical protein FWF48_03255 [Candidatus Saccharibacteria bacterium]|nr:hypothetical protein [Candidatus Saccharibacteria bacterium]